VRQAKVKLSVTVSADLCEAIDRAVHRRTFPTRSAIVEKALVGWARAQRDAEIDAYYDATTEADRVEGRLLAEAGYVALAASARRDDVLDGPSQPRRPPRVLARRPARRTR
jgi:metal-responsive CopG/Arc/MetJ family transcriptional regulator